LYEPVPVTFLASLLSYNEIKRGLPWLARLIDKSPQARSVPILESPFSFDHL
jgi:hypothetical protein